MATTRESPLCCCDILTGIGHMENSEVRYSFGEFVLDPAARTLGQAGEDIAIEPKVFDLLCLLVRNRQRAVLKDELIDSIWPDRVISDAALSTCVKNARQAIGDSGSTQRWIKTLHGLGFRFVGKVIEQACVDLSASTADDRRGGVGPGAGIDASPGSDPDAHRLDARPCIVVLPFRFRGAKSRAVIAEGLAHDVTVCLSRLRWLKVISRASAVRLNGPAFDAGTIRQLVGAQYCVSGFLEPQGAGLSIHLQVEDTASQSVIWAERFSSDGRLLHDLRQELVRQIIAGLELRLSEQETQRARIKNSEDLNAWEAYHLGNAHYLRFSAADNRKAGALLNHAVALDPEFGRAHAALSCVEFQNAFNGYPGVDRLQAVERAMRHAERAIDLDRLDPLANFAMGRVYWLTGEPAASLPWLERALSLNPNYAQGYYARGLAALLSQNNSRSYRESEHAVELSPLDPFLYGFYGIRAFSYLADGKKDAAHEWARRSAYQPGALPVMDLLAAVTSLGTGQQDCAEQWLARARKRNPSIDSAQFFRALPFPSGPLRHQLASAFNQLGI